jgi:hypothetical protein
MRLPPNRWERYAFKDEKAAQDAAIAKRAAEYAAEEPVAAMQVRKDDYHVANNLQSNQWIDEQVGTPSLARVENPKWARPYFSAAQKTHPKYNVANNIQSSEWIDEQVGTASLARIENPKWARPYFSAAQYPHWEKLHPRTYNATAYVDDAPADFVVEPSAIPATPATIPEV